MRAEKHTEQLLVRLTKREKEALCQQAKANGQNVSSYVRMILARPPDVTRKEFEEVNLRLVYEINKIGVNINQIAKKYNEHRLTKASRDVMDKMDEIRKLLNEVMRTFHPD
ncbi:MAG: MobC family plasmid mobilization relaxosome protein [Roseburia sp.]|nr:MobC family plasmid mobilization relaxosome protein [Roseburia sp.]